jgi:hypothetical protein
MKSLNSFLEEGKKKEKKRRGEVERRKKREIGCLNSAPEAVNVTPVTRVKCDRKTLGSRRKYEMRLWEIGHGSAGAKAGPLG